MNTWLIALIIILAIILIILGLIIAFTSSNSSDCLKYYNCKNDLIRMNNLLSYLDKYKPGIKLEYLSSNPKSGAIHGSVNDQVIYLYNVQPELKEQLEKHIVPSSGRTPILYDDTLIKNASIDQYDKVFNGTYVWKDNDNDYIIFTFLYNIPSAYGKELYIK